MMRFTTAIFILISLRAFAGGVFEYQRPIWSMGMGGVYTPFPRESDMPTANPAYLRYVKSMNLELLNFTVGAPGMNAIAEFQNLPPMNSLADLNAYMGKTIWTGSEGRVSFVAPYFGISVYDNFYLRSYFSNPLMPEWNLDFINDYGFTAASATALGPDLSLGFAIKRINRWGGNNALGFDLIDQYISTQDTNVILDQFSDKGIAYGMDMSLLWKTENNSSPIVTLVWKDVGNTTFQKTSGSAAPPHIGENLILGVGYILDGPGVDLKTGFEYRNIRTKNVQLGEKLHAGMEVSLPLVDLRFGMSQGYATYGLGLDLWVFRIDIAQYTVEEGFYPGQTPDQRIQFGLTLDLSVDADFRISGANSRDGVGGSSRRKLKERR